MVAQQLAIQLPNRRNQRREAPAKAGKSPRQKAACQNAGAQVTSNTAPGYDGYMGTYVDPDNGDIVTLRFAPTRRNQNQDYQNYPIIIEPDVSGWGNNWNNGWNNSGWAGPTWARQQVPATHTTRLSPDFSHQARFQAIPFRHRPWLRGLRRPLNGPEYAPSLPGKAILPEIRNIPGTDAARAASGPGFGPGAGHQTASSAKAQFRPRLSAAFAAAIRAWQQEPGFGHGPNFGHRPGFRPWAKLWRSGLSKAIGQTLGTGLVWTRGQISATDLDLGLA